MSSNPDLIEKKKKNMGCLNGIFSLFDRHHFLARRINCHNQTNLPPVGKSSNQVAEFNSTHQEATQKDSNNVLKEIRTPSTESTRASVSSCSPSFSSTDYTKSVPIESCLSSKTIYTETSSIHDMTANRPNLTNQSSKQRLDIGDIKNSMHREVRGIAVKTTAKDGDVAHTLTYIDSPRPSEPPKFVKPRLSVLNESFQVIAKLREAPRSANNNKDSCMHWAPKESRRLSYDGKDAHKSTILLKELPRLSLDSRSGSLRGSNSQAKSNSNQMMDLLQQEPGSSKRSSSSILAKLMGLETLPDSTSINGVQSRFNNTCQTDRHDFQSKASTARNDKQHSFSASQKNAKDLASNQMKNVDLTVIKTISSQKFPLKTAPGRHIHGSRSSQPPGSKGQEATARATKSSPSVYSEIEKRFAELEFKKSGKDLRALKQILEAMEKTKDMLANKKDQTSSFESQTSNNNSLDHSSNLESHKSLLQSDISFSRKAKASNPPISYKSPIIIMKPGKLHRKDTDTASAVSLTSRCRLQTSGSKIHKKELVEKQAPKHPTQKNVHNTNYKTGSQSSTDKIANTSTLKSIQASKAPQNNREGNGCGSAKTKRTAILDLQQREFGLDKQPHQVIPSSDSSRTRRHCSRQQIESGSPARKDMSESPNLQRSKDQLSEAKTNIRYLSPQVDNLTIQLESPISLDSHTNKETNPVIQPKDIKNTHFKHDSKDQGDPAVGLSRAEPGKASAEQPSPVSVLDATFYRDDLPSPVKKTSIAFKDDETSYPDEVKLQMMELAKQSSRESCVSSEIDIKTLDMKKLVQDPEQANFSHPVIIHYDSTNSDHKYISDILSASALLGYLDSSLTSIQFQKLDNTINPQLFFALEQANTSTNFLCDANKCENMLQLNYDETIHRKLIFDVVNEILCNKLMADSSSQCLVQKPRHQHLVGKICLEVDRIQGHDSTSSLVDEDDYMRRIIPEDLMDWSECDSEIPGVVLDIEQLIFNDLITDVATVMIAVSQDRQVDTAGNCFPSSIFQRRNMSCPMS